MWVLFHSASVQLYTEQQSLSKKLNAEPNAKEMTASPYTAPSNFLPGK